MSLEISIHEGESQELLLHRFQKVVQNFLPKSEAAGALKPRRAHDRSGDEAIKRNREQNLG